MPTADAELKTIREWLYDYSVMIEGTQMENVLADVLPREVESYAEARAQVDRRINMQIAWLEGTRPTPSFIYEPEAFEKWCADRGKPLPEHLKLKKEKP